MTALATRSWSRSRGLKIVSPKTQNGDKCQLLLSTHVFVFCFLWVPVPQLCLGHFWIWYLWKGMRKREPRWLIIILCLQLFTFNMFGRSNILHQFYHVFVLVRIMHKRNVNGIISDPWERQYECTEYKRFIFSCLSVCSVFRGIFFKSSSFYSDNNVIILEVEAIIHYIIAKIIIWC